MKLYIQNKLKEKDDKLISLAEKDIKFCLGCSSCIENLKNYCSISDDDMQELYINMIKADRIIIASPIYMNHITGILKNVIDRLNPFSNHGNLKGKKVYLLLIGQLSEEENKEVTSSIKEYFESIREFMEFEFYFIRTLTSGEVYGIDDIEKANENYKDILKEIKAVIER